MAIFLTFCISCLVIFLIMSGINKTNPEETQENMQLENTIEVLRTMRIGACTTEKMAIDSAIEILSEKMEDCSNDN